MARNPSDDPASHRGRWRAALWQVVLPLLLLATNLLVFAPFSIYFGNPDEYSLSFWQIIASSWNILLLTTAVACFAGSLLPVRWRATLGAVLFALVTLTWLESNILVASFGVLDGSDIDWSQHQWRRWLDGGLWLGLLALAALRSRLVLKPLAIISVLVFLTQLIFAGWTFSQSKLGKRPPLTSVSQPPAELFELSADSNVLYLVLDEFSSEIFAAILEEDADFMEELTGFTFFEHNTGVFPTTIAAIPTLLSGRLYRNDIPFPEFIEGVNEASIGRLLEQRGFLSDEVHLNAMFGSRQIHSRYILPRPYTSLDEYLHTWRMRMLDHALFRSAPHSLKKLIHADGRWLLARLEIPEAPPQSAVEFARELIAGLHVVDSAPRFKFIHLLLPHAPFVVDAECRSTDRQKASYAAASDQARCAVSLTRQLLNRLRQLAVYDDCLIIISSDHGWKVPPKGFRQHTARLKKSVAGAALALLAIKPPQASGMLQISTAPTSSLDIPKTIADLLDLDIELPGRAAFSLGEDEARQRTFIDYHWEHRLWKQEFLPALETYAIDGDPLDELSWSQGGVLLAHSSSQSSMIDFGTDQALPHLGSLGWSSSQRYEDRDVAWARGTEVSVNVSLPAGRELLLRVALINPSVNPNQTVSVSVDHQDVGRWVIEHSQRWLDLELVLPPRDPRPPVSVIRFELSKLRKVAGKRRPAVAFDKLSISATDGWLY